MAKKINDDQILITDDEGKEYLFNILFTYDNEERKAQYVFFFDPEDEENVIVMRYDDDGNLEDIKDDDEYNETQEVFEAYMNDPKISEAKK